MTQHARNSTKVMAISSAGGHWEQLMMLRNSWDEVDSFYVNTMEGLAEKSDVKHCYVIPDCNRNKPASFFLCGTQIYKILSREKPTVIVSTGAAPGLIALLMGRIWGIKTIWIDSVANAEKLSLSGKIASAFTDVCITQWSHIAELPRLKYYGSVL